MVIATRQRVSFALAATVLLGVAASLQVYVNGRLGGVLGSPEIAAVVNNVVGLLAFAAVLAPTRAVSRAWRVRASIRWWHLSGGAFSAIIVASFTFLAPELGVALLTVGLVGGQTTGSLVADRAGVSPGGRQAISAGRVASVALAIAAVVVSVIGKDVGDHPWLIAFALGAGVAVAGQQAANGSLTAITREPGVTAALNFGIGLVPLAVVAAVATGFSPPHGWSLPPLLAIGGLLGAMVVTGLAVVVVRVGVLRALLALTAGQMAGAVAIDLVAPAEGRPVTLTTLLGVALAFAAIVAARERRNEPPDRAR